jgi:hypothetical protein
MGAERKVQAGTAAAAVSGVVLWVLGRYVFRGAVPDVFASWIYAIVPGLVTFAAGYLAKHTPRPAVPRALAPYEAPSSRVPVAEPAVPEPEQSPAAVKEPGVPPG